MPHLQDTIQKVGAAQYITVLDAKSGYWQFGMSAYDDGIYEWCRLPFGLQISGRCIHFVDVFSSFLNQYKIFVFHLLTICQCVQTIGCNIYLIYLYLYVSD